MPRYRLRTLLTETVERIDFHIVWMLIIVIPLVLFWSLMVLPVLWGLLIVAAIPQGRIFTRWMDYRAMKRPYLAYFIANECVACFAVALTAAAIGMLTN